MSSSRQQVRLVVTCVLVVCVSTASAAIISNGSIAVEINEHGLVVGVPSGPLSTIDGPAAVLRERVAEWYGVSFDGPRGPVEGCGRGLKPDWDDRTPVEMVSFSATADSATSVGQIGELEIRTDFWFDADGPYLIAAVTLTNRGPDVLRNLLYTREHETSEQGAVGWTFPDDIPGVAPAPTNLKRRVWMFYQLRPGASTGLGLAYTPLESPARGGGDVPLSLWTNDDYPSGLPVGATNGISFGDYDADGWIDMFACQSANLWRNVDGVTWELAADLDSELPYASSRYGSSFGDYDNDGLPDIGTEPRPSGGDSCLHLLHNLGGGPFFEDVSTDPEIIDVQPCNAYSETICWGDVDRDDDLDLFLPAYPPWVVGDGNFFLRNMGPTGPDGAYRFIEYTLAGGFDNPPGSARPEGAQFADVDFDGDMELYSNGTLYQNNSTIGVPLVAAMTEEASGIGLSTELDEGAALADYDLDGDYDLFIVYTDASLGVRIWENYGDGMFFGVESGVVESPSIGLNLGLSTEDWDNDGDMDFTTRQVFRQNMLIETGTRLFIVASHSIPAGHLTSATPSWGDWDKDGDLDCALGNWMSVGHFYLNTTYDEATPLEQRRYVRIRPLRDSDSVPAGLETEYATSVEIHVLGDTSGYKRRKFTASGSGYLNQNEYTLHFALPADPQPGDPNEDLHLDVTVDFPSLPSEGLRRVDKHVNPALGNINLADLNDREIIVFRSGIVSLNGTSVPPRRRESSPLITGAGGLALPTPTEPLPEPVSAPSGNRFVGLDFETADSAERLRLREIIIDGALVTVRPAGDILHDDFETDQGWTVEDIDLTDGSWERGVPAGDGERGDPTTDFDRSGQCYLTANRAGNSDVDGGPTRLISPSVDLSQAPDPALKYARWFANDDQDEDRLDVEISNDDGESWTLIESVPDTVGWVERTVRITDFITPTAQMKVRFSATDNPNDSVTEAAIDALDVFSTPDITNCGGQSFAMALWDVTDSEAPILVTTLNGTTSDRNRRSYFRTDILLAAARHYRLVARVSELRETPISGPVIQDNLTILGGLSFDDDDPCTGAAVAAAASDPAHMYLTVRAGVVTPATGDFDEDGDVDVDDYFAFLGCLNGPDILPDPDPPTTANDCLDFSDSDLDEDVDVADFAFLQENFTG